jgi:hypothetical protein
VKDAYNSLLVKNSLTPAARTASANGTSVDRAASGSLFQDAMVVIPVGTVTDGTHTFEVQHSDDNSSWAAVADAYLQGSEHGRDRVRDRLQGREAVPARRGDRGQCHDGRPVQRPGRAGQPARGTGAQLMARIKVLEAIAGPDFSWSPGDIVSVCEEDAASWADGHRAVLLDDGQEPGGEPAPSMFHQQPLVVDEAGEELEVIAATLEDIDPPAGQDNGPRWVRWSVTVRLPGPGRGPDGGDQAEAEVQEKQDQDGPDAPASAAFDPREHTNRQVLAYLDTVGYEEALRVLDLEATEGENRAGIAKQRDEVLNAARVRDAAASGGPGGAEKAADTSRGGGRGQTPETRSW